VHVVTSQTKIEQVRVRAAMPLTIVRDVAWDPGWRGSVSVDGHAPRSLRVSQRGLVEEVHVPAGNDLVTFNYRPPHLLAATLLSLGAVVLLLVLLAATVIRRLTGRRRSSP
jgi:hypothetical protein